MINNYRYRKVIYPEGENKVNWRLIAGALGALIISVCGWWWPLKLIVTLIFWSTLAADHLINVCEELQLRKYTGFSDLCQRILVLYYSKKLLLDEVTRFSGPYLYERNRRIIVPWVNVYISHQQGFTGTIEIELRPEYDALLNDPNFLRMLTSQLKRFAGHFIVTVSQKSDSGNSIVYQLEDLKASNQIRISSSLQIYPSPLVALDKKTCIDWDKEFHAVISGVTGSGKTMLIEYMVANAKKNGWDIRILDPKQSDLARIQESDQIVVACEKDDMLELLHESVKEMQHAQRRYKEDPTVALTPHLIVVDELAALRAMLDRKEQQQLLDDLKQLSLLGRQAKFHLVVGVQQANANNIPTEIREQMGIKILLGNSTSEERKFLFSECQLDNPIENVGQGLISINNSSVKLFHAPWIETEELNLIDWLNIN